MMTGHAGVYRAFRPILMTLQQRLHAERPAGVHMNTPSPPGSGPFRPNDEVASHIETEIRRRYSAIRSGAPKGTSTTLLYIGTEQTGFVTGSDSEPETLLVLGIGSRKTAREYFKHVPPTPGEMEKAIAAVENEV